MARATTSIDPLKRRSFAWTMHANLMSLKLISRKCTVVLSRHRCLSSDQTFLQKAWMGWKHLTGQIPPTHRENVELHELRLALLSIHYGILQKENHVGSHDDKIEKIWQEHSGLKNIGMRYEVQVELVPDILEIFETFDKVDRQMNSVHEMDVLKQDYEETLRDGHQYPEKADFINIKRDALEILIRHFWYQCTNSWQIVAVGEYKDDRMVWRTRCIRIQWQRRLWRYVCCNSPASTKKHGAFVSH